MIMRTCKVWYFHQKPTLMKCSFNMRHLHKVPNFNVDIANTSFIPSNFIVRLLACRNYSISRHLEKEKNQIDSLKRKSTIAHDEVHKFASASKEWWNPKGQFAMLHRMNPVRVQYIREMITQHASHEIDLVYPLKGLRILDIGCGGGLLSESLKRLGADVVGADAAKENIQMASFHMSLDYKLSTGPGSLEFRHATAEQLIDEGENEKFDIVCGLEIIEHVSDRMHFLSCCSNLTKPNGLLFFSTMNRTLLSKLLTIELAENILGLVPKGTHDHQKYVTPEEFQFELSQISCRVFDTTGLHYHFLTQTWEKSLWKDFGELQVNYILAAQKKEVE